MLSKITFFNVGNADTTLIQLNSERNVLWDYANMQGERHCNLPDELNSRVKCGYFDVVCFTHADEDHLKGMSEYFYLEHADKYKVSTRKKIQDLWVPAALLLESRNDYCYDAKILKAEAKHRFLTTKKGVKVFSKPDALKDWVENEGVAFKEIEHLIVDAGGLVPGWQKDTDGIEFFVHSPFKGHIDDTDIIRRNEATIIVQAVFGNATQTKLILGSDVDSENLRDIVKITKWHKNESRLLWDIFHLCHHCSYKAINKDDKGRTKTIPIDEVKWLMETQGQMGGILISPSDIIPPNDTDQPPHKQAYNYYKEDVANKKNGKIIVTMENPTKTKPEPLELTIEEHGVKRSEVSLTEDEKNTVIGSIIKKSESKGNWAK